LVLNTKLAILQHDLEAVQTPTETKMLAVQQVLAEIKREECELEAAYTSLSTGMMVSERFVAEMVEGFEPSIDYTRGEIMRGHLREKELLLEALESDYLQRRCIKKKIAANLQRGLEERRLMTLDRPPEDLIPIYEKIQSRLESDLIALREQYMSEREGVISLLLAQYNEKNDIQVGYSDDILVISESHRADTDGLKTEWLAQREELDQNVGPEVDIQLYTLDQNYAASSTSLECEYYEKLYQAFKRCMIRKTLEENIGDNLRALQQRLELGLGLRIG
jgi:hypothetical protein